MLEILIDSDIFRFKIIKDGKELNWEDLNWKEMEHVYSCLKYQTTMFEDFFKGQLKK